MSDKQEILKIEIPIEEEEQAPAAPKSKKKRQINIKKGAGRVGEGVNQAAKKAWGSSTRKSVTGGVKKGVAKGTTAVAAKSAELIHEHMVKAAEKQAKQQASHMQTKIRETDWPAEARKGAAGGLRWASKQVGKLAARLTPSPEAPPTKASQTDDS